MAENDIIEMFEDLVRELKEANKHAEHTISVLQDAENKLAFCKNKAQCKKFFETHSELLREVFSEYVMLLNRLLVLKNKLAFVKAIDIASYLLEEGE